MATNNHFSETEVRRIAENVIDRSKRKLPANEFFDNQKWVIENESHLFPNDPQKTFKYILMNHPFGGCSFDVAVGGPLWTPLVLQSTESLARYADAVTVCCFDSFPQKRDDGSQEELQMYANETLVGNCAFVALNHSNKEIRSHCLRQLKTWRNRLCLSLFTLPLAVILPLLLVVLFYVWADAHASFSEVLVVIPMIFKALFRTFYRTVITLYYVLLDQPIPV